jgi:cytidylate kinase
LEAFGAVTKRIITISRQYGSGGREIGEKVAAALGYGYYDDELIRRAAKEGDISEDLVREEGEGVMGKLSSLLSFGNSSAGADQDSLPIGERIFLAEAKTIKQIAEEGPCVIIGHSADYFLADYPELLNVYIHSDWDARVARVMARNDLDERTAITRIKRTDRKRAAYYEQYTDQRWGKASNYHLSLSSSFFGIQTTAELIAAVAQKS